MDKQQNDFAARLERIQARAPEQQPIEEVAPRRKVPGTQGVNRVMVYSTLAVLAVAIAGFGGLFLILPDEEARAARQVAEAPKPQPSKPKVAPLSAGAEVFKVAADKSQRKPDKATRFLSDLGWRLWATEVAAEDQRALNINEVAVGFDPNHRGKPDVVLPLATNSDCTLRRPQAGEVVRNVRLGYATGPGAIHSLSNADMADALLEHLEGQQVSQRHYQYGKTASGRLQQVDVFLTDTSAPIYLVLQALQGGTLWNVQTAPGVTLSHVAMIGENIALADLPESTSFEAIRISDFVTNFEFGANETFRECMVAPYRLPKEHWKGVARARAGNDLFVNQMFSYNTGHAAYDGWYTSVLGVDAETNVTEAHNAAHVLSGPLPEAPLTYQSIEGRTVHVSANDHVLTSDIAVKEAHAALLLAAVGGDISLLDPAPRERTGE